ncbi:MAG: OST-HTH/LOTUS domain-containing protein [Pseudonocardiales bacterium]|nr:OST-HTH/LOTUS domain-containing protein [Pseudonocardiales bacterium]
MADFEEANYGCRSFRDFLARLGHRVRTAGRSGADITLALIDQHTGDVTAPGL